MAAKWAEISWKQFEKLDGEEQSDIIATYRTANQIEAVLASERDKEAKRKSKNNTRPPRRGRRR